MVNIIGVRFRSAGKVYYFDVKDFLLHTGDHVIVETARGPEYGVVATRAREVSDDMVAQPLRSVIRFATEDDELKRAQLKEKEKEALRVCREKIRKHSLDMKLVDAEYAFDENHILFYFTADGRIDFRDLVKDLASVFHTRIELRQIGVRDETRMLGGIGSCGRELCCATYLNDFAPVSIKMAKEQNLSLNPGKISGICGRLMCCLKNEEDTYEFLNQKMPKMGSAATTADGRIGKVIELNVLRQRVRVLFEEGDNKEVESFDVGELTFTPRKRRDEGENGRQGGKQAGRQDEKSGKHTGRPEGQSVKQGRRPEKKPEGMSEAPVSAEAVREAGVTLSAEAAEVTGVSATVEAAELTGVSVTAEAAEVTVTAGSTETAEVAVTAAESVLTGAEETDSASERSVVEENQSGEKLQKDENKPERRRRPRRRRSGRPQGEGELQGEGSSAEGARNEGRRRDDRQEGGRRRDDRRRDGSRRDGSSAEGAGNDGRQRDDHQREDRQRQGRRRWEGRRDGESQNRQGGENQNRQPRKERGGDGQDRRNRGEGRSDEQDRRPRGERPARRDRKPEAQEGEPQKRTNEMAIYAKKS